MSSSEPQTKKPPKRARTDAQPWLLEIAQRELLQQINEVISRISEDAAAQHGQDPAAVKAALCVLVESGLLTDYTARSAAIRHELSVIEKGGSAQEAHRELGDLLGMTRQGVESRLSLVGSKPGRRGGPPADRLRKEVTAAWHDRRTSTSSTEQTRPAPQA